MGLLFAEILIQVFIRSSIKDEIDLHTWQAIVTAVVACSFRDALVELGGFVADPGAAGSG